MAKNPCAKTVTPEQAYEIWQSEDGFTYYVLKKYQSPEHEERNEFSRWYVFTTSPMVPKGEYGDGYAKEIKEKAHKLSFNPLDRSSVQEAS